MGGFMEFSSIYEEENKFPCENISYEEGRIVRYLLMETEIFKNGEIVTMSLSKPKKYIYGNGLFWDKDGCNQAFEAFICEQKDGYEMVIDSQEVISKKRRESLEKFVFDKEDIKVISKIKGEEMIKTIPYWEESLKRV